MAYAAYSELLGPSLNPRATPSPRRELLVLDFTVCDNDAHVTRRALARCQGVGVLRSIPKPFDHQVCLELQVRSDMMDNVLHCLMVCVPSGKIGQVHSWQGHLARHGLPYGH